MSIYEIIKAPHETLTSVAKAVTAVTPQVCRVLDKLEATRVDANGVGLAAPQVNISKRLAVVDADDGLGLWELINPEIIDADGEEDGEEGCLSIPGVTAVVTRAKHVTVRTLNRDGKTVEYTATGLRARCLQHEIDHLDGILITMRAKEILPQGERRGSPRD